MSRGIVRRGRGKKLSVVYTVGICLFLVFSLQLLSPPHSFFVFGDGFCDMCTFFTREHWPPPRPRAY